MNKRKTIITIGMFDGIHSGHRHLLSYLNLLAHNLGMQQAVFSFSDHPLSVICPEKAPKLLTDAPLKYSLLNDYNSKVYIMECSKDLFKMTATEFILYIKKNIVNVHAVLLGYNSTFGSDQPAPEQLAEQLAKYKIKVYVCDKYDKTEVSSSYIRKEIEKGNIDVTKHLMSRFLTINGKVVKGIQKGTLLGFPTANLEVDERMIVPGPGVYAGICKGHPAMINIGSAPTIRKDGKIVIEVHIIGGNYKLYGKKLEVAFIKRLRDEKKFDTIDDLKVQLNKDRLAATEALERLKNKKIPKEEC